MDKPTYKDAEMMLKMVEWMWSSGIPEINNWIWSEEFEPNFTKFVKKNPPGSEGFLKAIKICNVYETIGTFYKHGLVNRELLFDLLTVSSLWDRVEGFAIGVREDAGLSVLFENFERMAKDARS
jgi:hypothetical protein